MQQLETISIERQSHPDLSTEQPFSIVGEYCRGPRTEFHGDMHYALQICIVLTGELEILFEDFQRVYGPGEMFFTMCWEPHAYRPLGKRNFFIAVNIDIDRIGTPDLFGDCDWLLPFTVEPALRYCPETEKERREVSSFGRHLCRLYRERPVFWRQEMWLAIHQLLLLAIRNTEAEEGAPPGIFVRIRPALDLARKISSRPPELEQAAIACALSKSRFSELFRLAMGVSFGKFAGRVRMANATRDLLEGQMTVEEIAERWGFSDASHFCHAFRAVYKCPPREFRRRNG